MTKDEIDAVWDRVAHRYGIDQRDVDWLGLRAGWEQMSMLNEALLGTPPEPLPRDRRWPDEVHQHMKTLFAPEHDLRACICADPENCKEPVPDRFCRRGTQKTETVVAGSPASKGVD